MTKLFFKTGSILMFAFCLVLTSCQDDLNTDDSIFNYEEGIAAASINGNSCFELVYPVTVELSDGTQLSVADNSELREAARIDKETNGSEAGRPDLIYPVEVIVDGVTQTISDQESLQVIAEGCGNGRRNHRGGKGGKGGKGKGGSCINLTFPLTLNFADGTTATVESREEAKEAAEAYKEANPESDARPELQFPVTVTLEDGTEQVVASQEELDTLKEACAGSRGERGRGHRDRAEKCFSLEYPVSFAFEDGSTVTADSRDALKEAFQEYKEANPDVSERPQVQYPISIAFEDGSTQSIANEEELEAVKDMCDTDDDDDDDDSN